MREKQRKQRKGSASSGGLLGLFTDWTLLFLTLVSTALSVVTAYHMETVPHLLLAGAALISLVVLALVSLPKYKLPLTMAALSAWGYGLWRLWEPLVWGGARIQCDVVNTMAAKLPGMGAIQPTAELAEELWPWLTTLWLLMVGAAFALVVGFFLCRVGMALPVILLTLLPILPALCVTEAPLAVPMALLLVVWATLVLTSLAEREDRRGAARLRPMALGVSLAAAALFLQTLPTQGTSQPLWAADLREDAIQTVSRMDLSSLFHGGWEGWRGSGSTEYVSLTTGGASRTGRMALRVHSTASGKFYLRGYSADVYTGQRWEPLDREAKEELEAIRESGVEPLLQQREDYRRLEGYFFGEDGSREPKYTATETMTIENVAAPGGCVYYPYVLAELPEGASFGGDSHLARERGEWTHEIPFYRPYVNQGLRYRDTSGQTEEETAYTNFVYAHELQVPEDLRETLEQWLRTTMMNYWGESAISWEEYAASWHAHQIEYGRIEAQWQNYRSSPDFPQNVCRDMGTTVGEVLEAWGGVVLYGVQIEDSLSDQEGQYAQEERDNAVYFAYMNWAMENDLHQVDPATIDISGFLTPEEQTQYRQTWTMAMATLLEQLVPQTATYDPDTPPPPEGEDYVDWFLNGSGRGYCMHFASAATLLFRAAGVPARYVSGYVVNVPRTGYAIVPDSAAHAWVEYYLEGTGWLPLEVTPGYEGNSTGEHPAQEFDPEATAPPTPTPTPSATPAAPSPSADTEGNTPPPTQPPQGGGPTGGGPGQTGGKGHTTLWPVLALFGFLCVILGRLWALKRRHARAENEQNRNAAVLWIYGLHQRLKPWGAADSQELTTLAEKAKFSQHTLTEEEHKNALSLLAQSLQQVKKALPPWRRPLFYLYWGSWQPL